MQRPIPEATFHIVLIGLVGYFLMESFSIRGSAAGGSLSPAFFPKAICILLIFFLLFSLFTTLVQSNDKKTRCNKGEEPSGTRLKSNTWAPCVAWLSVLFLLVLYAFLLEVLGYVIATAMLIFGMVSVLVILNKQGNEVTLKGVTKLAGFAVCTSLAIFMLFTKGFSITLPTLGVAGV